jgi:hypothetical protein
VSAKFLCFKVSALSLESQGRVIEKKNAVPTICLLITRSQIFIMTSMDRGVAVGGGGGGRFW